MGVGARQPISSEADRLNATPPIAVCAADATMLARINAALEIAGHEIVVACGTAGDLVEGVADEEPKLAVVALAFEPFLPSEDIELIRAALAELPLVVVASGFVGAACRRLVPTVLEGLVHEARLEHALAPTVDAVLANQLCVPSSMRGTLAQPVFSHREKQVLELLLTGLTNAEIAAQLFLSESTVKSHLASSFRKLGVSSRAEAAKCVLAPDSGLELRALSLAGGGPWVSGD